MVIRLRYGVKGGSGAGLIAGLAGGHGFGDGADCALVGVGGADPG